MERHHVKADHYLQVLPSFLSNSFFSPCSASIDSFFRLCSRSFPLTEYFLHKLHRIRQIDAKCIKEARDELKKCTNMDREASMQRGGKAKEKRQVWNRIGGKRIRW